MAKPRNAEEPEETRFRTTLSELERVHIPLDQQVTSSAQDRRPADSDLNRQQLDTRYAGGA